MAAQAAAGVYHGVANLREVLEVGAGTDMHMESRDPHAVVLGQLDAVLDLLVPHAVLAEGSAGVHLAGVAVAKARVHAKGQFRLHAEIGQLLDHVGGAHVYGDVMFLYQLEGVTVEDVGGIDDLGSLAFLLATLETRLEGADDFACGNGVYHATQFAYKRNDGEVRACLLGKADRVENLGFFDALLDGFAVVNPEGGAVLFGSLHKNFLGDSVIHGGKDSNWSLGFRV